jgi:mRNA interferase RelE/StbE
MPRSAEGDLSRAYRIFENRQSLRDLARLGPAAKRRLEIKLREHDYPALLQSSRFGPNIKRLRGWEPPTWRYRVGNWRFFYEIDERHHLVLMTVADHRGEIYR